MNTITYECAEMQPETVSVFLMTVLEYAQEIGLGELLEQVEVKLKTVTYNPVQKAQTILASLVMGCRHTQAINDVLSQETAAAQYLQMPRFPDQSQINRYLTRLSAENVAQLGEVHSQLFIQCSQARRASGMVVVDVDQCGLVANGKSYEFAKSGYFPNKRGEQGYQMSAAYIGAYDEAVAMYLDPGNSHCKARLPDLLRSIDRQLATDNPGCQIIRRLDAGYDSTENRQGLMDAPGYFIMKSAESSSAQALAHSIPIQAWIPVADGVHGVELPTVNGLRRLLYEVWHEEDKIVYMLLYTNLPQHEFGCIRCFTFYNERQTIESFFKQSRHVYNIQNLRSRQFTAIYAFLRFVFLAHNLIHWTKLTRLALSDLAAATTAQLVHHIARVRALVTCDNGWHLSIIGSSRWAQWLLVALQPRYIQLPLPFARLHKT